MEKKKYYVFLNSAEDDEYTILALTRKDAKKLEELMKYVNSGGEQVIGGAWAGSTSFSASEVYDSIEEAAEAIHDFFQ